MPAKMTVIMGRAGTGKTHYIMNKIAGNERKRLRSVLIVPDRATFETEKQLSEFLGGGILYAYVLSFTSLASRVLKEAGSDKTYLTEQGRQMLIRRAVEQNKAGLTAFARVSRHRGFTGECDEIILNCKRFLIDPAELESAGKGIPGNLGAKLRDFALIYAETRALMAEKYIDSEDMLNSVIEKLPASSLKGTEVFIDAPEALNESTLRIIGALLDTADSVTVTLRGDTSGDCRDGRIFEPDTDLYIKLKRICGAKGCDTEFIPLNAYKGNKSPALLHLERNLFAYPYEKYTKPAPEIEIDAEPDRVREVRAAAEACLKAARGGMRYREMAVVTADAEGYANIIKRVFNACGIPFFSEGGRSVSTHPIAELLLAALRCVEKGMEGNDFIRVFKTGFMDVSVDDAEKLENYILKYGLNGKRLTEPFDRKDIPEGVEEARQKIAEPLLKLKNSLGGRLSAARRIEALYDFLVDIDLPARLKADCDELNRAGRFVPARETAQVYDTVIELLNQLHVILGDEKLGLGKFSAILEEGLAAYSVSIIPTTLDQVLVGEFDGTALKADIRFLQVLGVNEGLIPNIRADNAIINDSDLAKMKKMGYRVWDGTEKRNKAENLRIYSILTGAAERLRLSYCADIFGESAAASPLISRITEIFPECRITDGMKTPSAGGAVNTAFPLLIERLRNMIDTDAEDEGAKALYAFFYAKPEYRELLLRADKAYFGDIAKAPLGQREISKLYGRSLTGTASRLETFNQCPYRFFLQYGMGLKERERLEEKATDYGSFIHEALDKFIDGIIEDKIDLNAFTREDAAKRLGSILPEMMKEHNNGIFLSSARMRAEFSRIAEQLYLTCYAIICQLAEGGFRPLGAEVSFGRQGDAFPPLIIETGGGASFRVCGIVDRIDGISSGDKAYMRIIDYKTGRQTFDFTELANGLKLQLPLYAAAMEAAFGLERKMKTAGFYYLILNDWDIEAEAEGGEELRRALLASFKLNGLTLKNESIIAAAGRASRGYVNTLTNVRYTKEGEISGRVATRTEMDDTLAFAGEKAAGTLTAIMNGIIDVSPAVYRNKNYCRFCPYGSVCRFDPTDGDRPRNLNGISKNAFFKNISHKTEPENSGS